MYQSSPIAYMVQEIIRSNHVRYFVARGYGFRPSTVANELSLASWNWMLTRNAGVAVEFADILKAFEYAQSLADESHTEIILFNPYKNNLF